MPVKSHLVVKVCLGQDITQSIGLGLNSFITSVHAFDQTNHDWSNQTFKKYIEKMVPISP